MGVLEFFGTLVRNDITSTSITSNYVGKLDVHHLLLDFNSIVHVSSQKILADVNQIQESVLKLLYQHRSIMNPVLTEKFEKYKMLDVAQKINPKADPEEVTKVFHDHFTQKFLDKLIITLVINTVLNIVRTYTINATIKTLMLAIDGVPSKGKLLEQRQRRYLGAITETYKQRILDEYDDYLLEQPDYVYYNNSSAIKWNRNKITPGTAFMEKLVRYLKADKYQAKIKMNRPNLKIIVSDMHEIGEGEKKIVNYVDQYLDSTPDTIMVYSPDADMILLCMLLPVDAVYMLRYNQQEFFYDLIDINMLKKNIGFYINNNPNYPNGKFNVERINRDLVCLSTLFGNDFVPKIESINVKRSFQTIMDAYLTTLIKFKEKGLYLVRRKEGKYHLSFVFLKHILQALLPEENDFIKHNRLYQEFIAIGQIKYVFDYMEINSENLISTVRDFNREYDKLKHTIKNNQDAVAFLTNDQFMKSLKRGLVVIMKGQNVNTTYLKNNELVRLLRNYYRQFRDFPRLNINLNTYSHTITDPYQKLKIKGMNDYQKELYKFDHMLDEYYTKFNAQPLDLSNDKIKYYYKTYFGVNLYIKNNTLSKDANEVMHNYLEGLVWVFDYYFNDPSYISTWYYSHERAPLIRHLVMFLDGDHDLSDTFDNLNQYQVTDLKSYFNPVEQLMYVSPLTPGIIKLMPPNYREYFRSDKIDPFLKNFYVNIDDVVDRMRNQKVSNEIDCHSIIFLNKCLVKSIERPVTENDELFLKAVRKVKPDKIYKIRARNEMPEY